MTTREDEWAALLRAAIAGDGRAYARFLHAVSPVLRGIVRARGSSLPPDHHEDIVQEVLIAIHAKRQTWDSAAPLLPWLYAITRYKIVDAFRRRGNRVHLPIEDFADPAKRAEWIEQRNMLVFQLWDPGNPLRSLDVFVKEPIELEALMRDAQIKDVDGLAVPVASIEHLIQLKQAAGRPRDLDDIAKLRLIREERARHGQG